MNFLTKKVLEYQQKKLEQAKNNLQYSLAKRKEFGDINPDNKKEVKKIEDMIKIWTKNVNKIEQEIRKIQEKQ